MEIEVIFIEVIRHFSVVFDTASKFIIAFATLILRKVGVDRRTGPQRKGDVR